jgi:hypothetical protein
MLIFWPKILLILENPGLSKKTSSCILITEYFKNQILQMNYSGKLEFVLILLELRRMKRHTAANMYLQTSFPYIGSVIAPFQFAKIDKEM